MKNRYRNWAGGLIIAALVMTGCAAPAHIEKDDTVNFNEYRSFGWLESSKDKKNSLTEKRIREAVTAELIKAGWKQNERRPDVYLNYDVVVERNTRESSDPLYSTPTTRYLYNPYTRRVVAVYYPSRFMGYDRREQTIREGTVTISMIDAQSDKVVWQGWTTDEVNSRNLTSKEINAAVRSIFKKFDLAKK